MALALGPWLDTLLVKHALLISVGPKLKNHEI
jgi:hypothetical protein